MLSLPSCPDDDATTGVHGCLEMVGGGELVRECHGTQKGGWPEWEGVGIVMPRLQLASRHVSRLEAAEEI